MRKRLNEVKRLIKEKDIKNARELWETLEIEDRETFIQVALFTIQKVIPSILHSYIVLARKEWEEIPGLTRNALNEFYGGFLIEK